MSYDKLPVYISRNVNVFNRSEKSDLAVMFTCARLRSNSVLFGSFAASLRLIKSVMSINAFSVPKGLSSAAAKKVFEFSENLLCFRLLWRSWLDEPDIYEHTASCSMRNPFRSYRTRLCRRASTGDAAG